MTNFYFKKQYLLNDRKSAVADGPRDALCGLKPCKMSNSELATDIFGQRSTLSCPAPQWSFRDFGATIQTSQVTTYLLIRLNKIIRITEGKSIDRAISVKKEVSRKGRFVRFPVLHRQTTMVIYGCYGVKSAATSVPRDPPEAIRSDAAYYCC